MFEGLDDLLVGDRAHGGIEDELIAQRPGDAVRLLREEHDFVGRRAFDRAGAIFPDAGHGAKDGALTRAIGPHDQQALAALQSEIEVLDEQVIALRRVEREHAELEARAIGL